MSSSKLFEHAEHVKTAIWHVGGQKTRFVPKINLLPILTPKMAYFWGIPGMFKPGYLHQYRPSEKILEALNCPWYAKKAHHFLVIDSEQAASKMDLKINKRIPAN